MEYTDKVVAFIDILGFKKIITSDKYSEDSISFMLRSMKEVYEYDNYHNSSTIKPFLSVFSDNIFISYNLSEYPENEIFEDLIQRTSIMQAVLFSHGIFVRGGITKGKMIHNERECFGPAIVRAVELESKIAIYPRIVFDNNLEIEKILQNSKFKCVIEESEIGMKYLNFFSFLNMDRLTPIMDIDTTSFFSIRDILYKKLSEITDKDSENRPKIVWMIKKWNSFINEIIKSFPHVDSRYSDYLIEY